MDEFNTLEADDYDQRIVVRDPLKSPKLQRRVLQLADPGIDTSDEKAIASIRALIAVIEPLFIDNLKENPTWAHEYLMKFKGELLNGNCDYLLADVRPAISFLPIPKYNPNKMCVEIVVHPFDCYRGTICESEDDILWKDFDNVGQTTIECLAQNPSQELEFYDRVNLLNVFTAYLENKSGLYIGAIDGLHIQYEDIPEILEVLNFVAPGYDELSPVSNKNGQSILSAEKLELFKRKLIAYFRNMHNKKR